MAQGNVGENDLDAPLDGVIGNSDAMKAVYRLTRQASQSDASVLLLGETGVGKEVIAHSLHQLSERRTGPMITVNCGALSENLLESELFGHVKGAFTGAIANRTGRFEAAHNGTIFLDEINSTSLHLQIKLLRVLQESSVGGLNFLTAIGERANRDSRMINDRSLFGDIFHDVKDFSQNQLSLFV